MDRHGSRSRCLAALSAAALAAVGLLSTGAALATAQPEPRRERAAARSIPYVEATGEATVSETPDVATAWVGVTTEASTPGDAMTRNAALAQAVVKALRDVGLTAPDAIRTQAITVGPYFEDRPGERARIAGYRAANQVQIRVTDLARLGPALDAALAAGATDIGGPQFALGKPEVADRRALEQAVGDARARAETMARALGQRLGRILRVQALDEPGFPRPETMALARTAAPSIPVEPGMITVRARVLIRAELQ
jgi:uncharacterized protein YggE